MTPETVQFDGDLSAAHAAAIAAVQEFFVDNAAPDCSIPPSLWAAGDFGTKIGLVHPDSPLEHVVELVNDAELGIEALTLVMTGFASDGTSKKELGEVVLVISQTQHEELCTVLKIGYAENGVRVLQKPLSADASMSRLPLLYKPTEH